LASPILRETIKKLKDRRALLRKQIKGPLEELRQIEEDLAALGAAPAGAGTRRPRATAGTRAPRGANQAAILRAIRNGATTPPEIAEKTGLSSATIKASVTNYLNKQKLITQGPNGLTLTKGGRDKLAELEAK
jgi:DNA-binding NarL/FixJ family response regulator